MGVLTDYFAANAAELAGASDRGVPDGVPRIDAKGFGVIPFGQLAHRLGAAGEGVEPGEPLLHADDFGWFVQRIVPSMAGALAKMTDAAIAEHAAKLAETEDLDWEVEPTRELLGRLRDLATQASGKKRDLYLWCST